MALFGNSKQPPEPDEPMPRVVRARPVPEGVSAYAPPGQRGEARSLTVPASYEPRTTAQQKTYAEGLQYVADLEAEVKRLEAELGRANNNVHLLEAANKILHEEKELLLSDRDHFKARNTEIMTRLRVASQVIVESLKEDRELREAQQSASDHGEAAVTAAIEGIDPNVELRVKPSDRGPILDRND